jgi:hypothetical protein
MASQRLDNCQLQRGLNHLLDINLFVYDFSGDLSDPLPVLQQNEVPWCV